MSRTGDNRRSRKLEPVEVIAGARALAKFRLTGPVVSDRQNALVAARAATLELLPRLRSSPFDLVIVTLAETASEPARDVTAGRARPSSVVPMLRERLSHVQAGVRAALEQLEGVERLRWALAVCDAPEPSDVGVWVDFTYSQRGLN